MNGWWYDTAAGRWLCRTLRHGDNLLKDATYTEVHSDRQYWLCWRCFQKVDVETGENFGN